MQSTQHGPGERPSSPPLNKKQPHSFATAQHDAATVATNYATAWHTANDVGRAPAQLRAMGYDKPTSARGRQLRQVASNATSVAPTTDEPSGTAALG